jgi:hypothetical protein
MQTIEGETKDHPHHKSCWVAHGDLNGTDIWSEQAGHGRTVHREFTALESGPVMGRIAAVNDWVDARGTPLLTERREYRFYNLPAEGRLLDMQVAFTPAAGDVVFGDTKEGGICSIRVATSMDVGKTAVGGGRFTLGTGAINEVEGWGRRAPWCDYCGPVAGRTVGIAIFDTPGNLRYPTYWHVRNYGLMTANPFGLSHFAGKPGGEPCGDYTLAQGTTLAFRYRLYIHAGNTEEAQVAAQYQHYINPPRVTVGE